MRRFLTLVSILSPLAMAFGAEAEPANSEYGRDLISVVTLGRHATFPTANGLPPRVWVSGQPSSTAFTASA